MERSGSAKIKAVILDYGEVLCYPPTEQEWARMAGLFFIEPGRFRPFWDRNRSQYDRGDLSSGMYWSMLATEAGIDLQPAHLQNLSQWDVEMWGHINSATVEWVRAMHSLGVKTGLLSNMPVDMIRYARRQFAWLEHFDHQTFSAEVGLIKPDPGIYRHALDGLGVAASESLFVDDREPNIHGARAVGMLAIQFSSIAQLRDDLVKLEFPIVPALAELDS